MQDKLSKVPAFLALLYFLSITATVSHVAVSVFGIVANWVRCEELSLRLNYALVLCCLRHYINSLFIYFVIYLLT